MKLERLVGLDIFRVCAAFIILMFHSSLHVNCYYGMLQSFVKMGAVFMTGFFILSGYALFYNYQNKDFTNIHNIILFYGKRLAGILPTYYIVAIIYILFLGKETHIQNIILVPIEILGLQSMFSSLFSVSHNGGTWFISCIIACYIIFPYIQMCVKQLDKKRKLLFIGICIFILFYSPVVVETFNIALIYDNPFFRILEFMIGIFLAALTLQIKKINVFTRLLLSKTAIVIEAILIVGGGNYYI